MKSTTQNKVWNIRAQKWVELQEPSHVPFFEAMLDHIQLQAGTRLLDAGCGAGGLSVLAAERGAQVSGLDAAEDMVRIAQERLPNIDLRVGDLMALPYDDHSFDVAISSMSFWYAEEPIEALRELARVTKAKGTLVIGTWGKREACESRYTFKAISDHLNLPMAISGKNPFAVGEPGYVEGLLQQLGIKPLDISTVQVVFHYANLDAYWDFTAPTTALQAQTHNVPLSELKTLLTDIAQQFQQPDGSIRFNNQFRYVVAQNS